MNLNLLDTAIQQKDAYSVNAMMNMMMIKAMMDTHQVLFGTGRIDQKHRIHRIKPKSSNLR